MKTNISQLIKRNTTNMIWCVFSTAICFFAVSCEDQGGTQKGSPYDPSKPIVLESFEPDSGGLATKVFINGQNFGTDPSMIKVYYNKARAAVVGSDGEHLYVVTPRQPGDTCDITVAVGDGAHVLGKDSVVFDRQFRYRTSVTVTTIAGRKGARELVGGTLTAATFDQPSTLCTDAEGNIFMSHWRVPYGFVMISEKRNLVQVLYTGDPLGVPTADAEGKVIMAPTDSGDGYYSFDPDAQWAPKRRLILHPTATEQAAGKKDFTINYKHAMAANKLDGHIYTRSHNGQLVRFDPVTRAGEQVAEGLLPSNDSYLTFHPVQHNLLLITYPGQHAIYTYDLDTKEHNLFAGIRSDAGWQDGERLNARFNTPSQVIVDQDGSIMIADYGNHCIRKIDPDGIVTTVIGKGGKADWVDGNPDDAMFNNPKGVAIDRDYNIYVADFSNNCVRKLAIE
ncbi:MAG: IPT/TIG domain-containing protein [Bacteroidales bacterium]|jgi:hypothetical protein|nr:IPT/TIG domain-containing protein [Bacteroidales bacterium]